MFPTLPLSLVCNLYHKMHGVGPKEEKQHNYCLIEDRSAANTNKAADVYDSFGWRIWHKSSALYYNHFIQFIISNRISNLGFGMMQVIKIFFKIAIYNLTNSVQESDVVKTLLWNYP